MFPHKNNFRITCFSNTNAKVPLDMLKSIKSRNLKMSSISKYYYDLPANIEENTLSCKRGYLKITEAESWTLTIGRLKAAWN